jgi:hypothetical protein
MTINTIKVTGGIVKYSNSTRTNALRFIMREGKRILQQADAVINYEDGVAVFSETEWNDVPLVEVSDERN